jgi:hypothetical protein
MSLDRVGCGGDFRRGSRCAPVFSGGRPPVSAEVWGLDAAAAPLMMQWGLLRLVSAESDDEEGDSAESLLPESVIGEVAVSFAVGDGTGHTFALWPSRFRSASADALNGIRVVTADGQLRVYKDRPWID